MPNALPNHLSQPCRDPGKGLLVTHSHTHTHNHDTDAHGRSLSLGSLPEEGDRAEPEIVKYRLYQSVTWELIPGSPGRGGWGRKEGSQHKRAFSQHVQNAPSPIPTPTPATTTQCPTPGNRYLSRAKSRQVYSTLWRQETQVLLSGDPGTG